MPSLRYVRPLTLNDLEQCEQLFPEPTFVPFIRQIKRQTESGYSLFGCFINNRLVGMIHISRQGAKNLKIRQVSPFPMLGNLVVHTDFRRQGIAAYLIQYSEEVLRTEGYRNVGLIVSATNPQAIQLYEKAAYVKAQQLPPRAGEDLGPRYYYKKEL